MVATLLGRVSTESSIQLNAQLTQVRHWWSRIFCETKAFISKPQVPPSWDWASQRGSNGKILNPRPSSCRSIAENLIRSHAHNLSPFVFGVQGWSPYKDKFRLGQRETSWHTFLKWPSSKVHHSTCKTVWRDGVQTKATITFLTIFLVCTVQNLFTSQETIYSPKNRPSVQSAKSLRLQPAMMKIHAIKIIFIFTSRWSLELFTTSPFISVCWWAAFMKNGQHESHHFFGEKIVATMCILTRSVGTQCWISLIPFHKIPWTADCCTQKGKTSLKTQNYVGKNLAVWVFDDKLTKCHFETGCSPLRFMGAASRCRETMEPCLRSYATCSVRIRQGSHTQVRSRCTRSYQGGHTQRVVLDFCLVWRDTKPGLQQLPVRSQTCPFLLSLPHPHWLSHWSHCHWLQIWCFQFFALFC